MSPIVHIVDVGSGTTESHANVTVWTSHRTLETISVEQLLNFTFEVIAFWQEIHDGLDFSADEDGGYSFGIFSVKFSTDGRELVAGSSDDSIYVYDLEANRVSLRTVAHTVNSISCLVLQLYI